MLTILSPSKGVDFFIQQFIAKFSLLMRLDWWKASKARTANFPRRSRFAAIDTLHVWTRRQNGLKELISSKYPWPNFTYKPIRTTLDIFTYGVGRVKSENHLGSFSPNPRNVRIGEELETRIQTSHCSAYLMFIGQKNGKG